MYRPIFVLLIVPPVLSWALFTGRAADDRADFVYVSGAEPETLDPALMTGLLDGRLAAAVLEGLTVYDPRDLSPRPGVAERWEVSKDRRTYTFHLRRCSWSNGDSVTAHDFVYAWRRVLSPKTGAQYAYQLYDYIENAKRFYKGEIADFGRVGVRALDDRTLRVHLTGPTPYFLDLTSFMTYLPVHRGCVETHGFRWTRPDNIVTNGAFRLKEWRLNEKIRLEKNPDYWDVANVQLDTIDALAIDSRNTTFNLYATGGADLITDVPLPLIGILRTRPDFHSSASLTTYFYRFNVTRPPFDDARVRKALALAIDKAAIVRHITRGGEIPARAFVPPAMPGYRGPQGLGCDPEQARRLLAEAGYPGGKGFRQIEILFNTSEAHRHIAEVIQQMWTEQLGIRAVLLNQEWGAYMHSMKSQQYDVARSVWIGDYTDPNTFLDMFVTGGGNNRTGWSHAGYDALIRRAATELDLRRRMELLSEAEAILVEQELPIAPIYYAASHMMYRPHVKGVYPNAREVFVLKFVRVDRTSRTPSGGAP